MSMLLRRAPSLLLVGSGALLVGAFAFQYWGELYPCPLCVWQRYPHGIVVAVAALAVGHQIGRRTRPIPWMLGLSALVLLGGAAIAAFHVGVEQGWWQGLENCAGPGVGATLEETLKLAQQGPAARCDEVPWSLFGISMAGYNFLFSLALAFIAVAGARRIAGERA